jgi:hypothetical protein
MSKSGMIMMLITEISITVITGFFFFKVLFTKPNPEPDSYLNNDEEDHKSN